MTERTSGLAAALERASSSSWEERARAGRELASFADVPEAAIALVRLLLDAADTAVTRQTAEALVRVGTVAAVRLIAVALAEADDNHTDWLQTGVCDGESGAEVVAACRELEHDREDVVRRGARQIAAWL